MNKFNDQPPQIHNGFVLLTLLFSGESKRVGITTLTEGVNDISILFLGGDVIVENSPTKERYVLMTTAEDEDKRPSPTYVLIRIFQNFLPVER